MCQMSRTHGPAATTTCSQRDRAPVGLRPSTTAPPSRAKPGTVTGAMQLDAERLALGPRGPSIDGMFSAYPPFFSCRTTVMFSACQSEKIDSM